ncbi:protein PLASTID TRANSCRIPTIONALLY ACTIVE 7-like [Salvia splendens]|uniref:protein PLASTID TRANSCRIPTIONALLY ACTIVE 7-like n=1 Tax=Salvia splendens TaxID=180675 RepID=UPI001C2745FE|nr:protein PLASTID TRANSCRIPTIONALLY ACTIVE 7-like [Salvia splendens]
MKSQDGSSSRNSGGSHRQVWRRRKLAKKDKMRIERVPFLEEQVRRIRETGELLTMDIERLLLSEDNRFDFVNDVAAEAKQYVENNRDEYGAKKAILHVISNRMNDSGVHRPEAYREDDLFKPGPGFLRQELYDK